LPENGGFCNKGNSQIESKIFYLKKSQYFKLAKRSSFNVPLQCVIKTGEKKIAAEKNRRGEKNRRENFPAQNRIFYPGANTTTFEFTATRPPL
jgi:hypothetical protein